MTYESVISPVDMHLYKDKFCTPRMREVLSEENLVAARLEVEATLAEVQAELGIIPAEAAREIRRVATLEHVSLEEYRAEYARKGHDIVALVWVLASKCENGWGEYVHWRSTTQDILWTANSLINRQALRMLREDLAALRHQLADLAQRHRLTVMPGRTHGQHCPPITFGFYLAVLAAAVDRHIDRLDECSERLLVGKVTGAVGTAASYGADAARLQDEICARLGLAVPRISESEISRDRVAELGNVCSLAVTTCEKLARDIWTQQRPEIAELAEPFRTGDQVGSSTLPHKRNPFSCEWVQGVAKVVRSNAYMLNELFVFDVRDGTRLAVEYMALPALLGMTDAVVTGMTAILEGLHVDEAAMRRNIDLAKGLSMDEPVMLRLADSLGRQTAHDLVYDCAMKAFESDEDFVALLLEQEQVAKLLTREDIETLMQYENYLGTAPDQVDAVVAHITDRAAADPPAVYAG